MLPTRKREREKGLGGGGGGYRKRERWHSALSECCTVGTTVLFAKSFCFSIPTERDRLSNDSLVGISRHLNLSESRYSLTKLD